MHIAPEISLTFIGALSLGFTVMPIYFIAVNKLNNVIGAKKSQPQTKLELTKVGVGIIVMIIVFLLPIKIMTMNISDNELGKYCISVHLGTLAISSIISMTILYKTGRIKAIWKIPFK